MPTSHIRNTFTLALIAGVVVVASPAPIVAQAVSAEALGPLTFRHIGPVGNRISSVSGVVGDLTAMWAPRPESLEDRGRRHHLEPIFDRRNRTAGRWRCRCPTRRSSG